MTPAPPQMPPPPLPAGASTYWSQLPLTRMRWHRDYRLGRSLVARGSLELVDGRLRLSGRHSSALRSTIVLLTRVAAVVGTLAGCAAVTLTSIGMSWRSQTLEWLAWSLPGFLAVALLAMLLSWLIRRVVEPKLSLVVDWGGVVALHSDGWSVDLSLTHGDKTWSARGRAKPVSQGSGMLLRAMRDGPWPAAAPDPSTGWPSPRSRRIDQVVVLSLLAVGVAGLVRTGPTLARALQGPPSTGPSVGVPDRLPAARLEALTQACPPGPDDAPTLRNWRTGDDLHWRIGSRGEEQDPANDAWQAISARWVVGQSSQPIDDGSGALADPRAVGLSLLVPVDQATTIRAALARGDLRQALCGGHVGRLDLATAAAATGASLSLQRDGTSLLAQVQTDEGPAKRWRLLLARQRDTSRIDWLDRCELAVWKDRLVLPRAAAALSLPGFFDSSQDQARALLVPAANVRAVRDRLEARAIQDGAVPCAEIDALAWTGLATPIVSTSSPRSQLAERATEQVRATPLFAPGASHDEIVTAVHHRYRDVLKDTAPRHPSRADSKSINAGYLDGLPWSALLDALSMQYDLPQVERIRQRLSGADPLGTLGELFILRLAEELLDRVQPNPVQTDAAEYEARVDVAEAWLDVNGGHEWVAAGRRVRVPSDQVAAYYQVVGHFLLVDVGRRVEQKMAHDVVFRATGLPLRARLQSHGINLDIEKSTARKALEAWVTGDFEYLGDRAVARLQEQVADQDRSIAAASTASYRLDNQWSASDGAARSATLLRDGHELGWVELFDASRVRVGYHQINGKGTSRAALGAGHTTLLATAGSYVTEDLKTAGLSASDGQISNFLISNKMDGLVIIDQQGRLALLDMRHGGRLPGQTTPIQPLERLADLHTLLRWLEEHHASAFQTHLLGASGDLAIDSTKASSALRERRLLVQAEYQGNPLVVFVDLPGTPKVTLYEATVIAIAALSSSEQDGGPGLDVIGVANLDVGSYNALESWSDDGQVLRKSWKPLGDTMNLVSVVRR